MRLLDTHTGRFVDFTNWRRLHYAILSHTWNGAEQTYQEVRAIQQNYGPDGHRLRPEPLPDSQSSSPGQGSTPVDTIWSDPSLSEKVRRACETARSHGYRYLWIDSCCIDKTSSSELSEAINSMYLWYRDASVCYAYLFDVEMDADPELWKLAFRMSRWFTRGWTLQELLAPRHIVFLTNEWLVIGTKLTLEVSGRGQRRSENVLGSNTPGNPCGGRGNCLLGIFDINMPTLYGEEILKRIPDQSIFVWDTMHPYTLRFFEQPILSANSAPPRFELLGTYTVAFAGSAHGFFRTGAVSPLPHDFCTQFLGLSETDHPLPDYTEAPYGMRTHFPMFPISKCIAYERFRSIDASDVDAKQWFLVVLGCRLDSHHEEHMLARLCYLDTSRAGAEVLKGMGVCRKPTAEERTDLFVLHADDIARLREHLEVRTVYLPHPNRALSPGVPHVPAECPDIVLSPWTCAVLEAEGYHVEHFGPTTEKPDNHQFALTRDGSTLCLELQFTPHECLLMVWWSRVAPELPPDPALQVPRKTRYLIHKDGFEPINMQAVGGGTLTLQVGFEVDVKPNPERTPFYLRVELGACASYKSPGLPVLRIQDRARASGSEQDEQTLLGSSGDGTSERGAGRDDRSSNAGRDGRGEQASEQSWTTFGRKMDDKVKGWWHSRRGERKSSTPASMSSSTAS
uniref:Extracellular metalloproteinase ) n=1 Tax=Ganoderma boninense TaxID=34458 RepID=A0A5K1JZV3_9APHY|nr:Extracellular metalloproteinase (EC (Fungalysin) [Ganoderma boninense]